jgi:hypothetical protein
VTAQGEAGAGLPDPPSSAESIDDDANDRTKAPIKMFPIVALNLAISSMMKTLAGLWIDHREAVIIFVSDKGEVTKRIKSSVEKQLRRSGRSPSEAPFESQMVPADDTRERDYTGHLASYYDQIISCVRGAESLLIFGPGEAKGELKKRLEKDNLGSRIVGIETVDKLTERQIAQKVRNHYSPGKDARHEGKSIRSRSA